MLSINIPSVVLGVILAAAQSLGSEPNPRGAVAYRKKVHDVSVLGPEASERVRPPVRFDVSLIGHRQVSHGMNFYSQEDEELLGHELAAFIEKHSDLITDHFITKYIDGLEQSISDNSDIRTPIKVKIVKDVEANAYSVPGFIYLEAGLILAAENEAQLVAALSHETAHIAGRHLTKLATQQRMWKWSSLAAGGPVGYLIGRKASPFLLLRMLRNLELEADVLGLQYEYASGYDPAEFVNLVKNLSSDEERPSLIERASDSHPPAEVRIAQAQWCIRMYLPTRDRSMVDTSEFQEVKDRVSMLMVSNE
jgi:predicted Zn-dependent protease